MATFAGLAMLGGMLALMALRVPIAAAMFVPGAVGYIALSGDAALLNLLKGSAVARLSAYDLSVIPLFLLMGQFAGHGGLGRALFEAAAAIVGHVRGGLAMATIASAAAFGAICGSSVATSAAITQVAYPEMRAHGYPGRLATAVLATGGTLGILIPPSVPLVIFAILTEQSVARLFAAAFVPGALAALGYLAVIAISCRRHPELGGRSTRATPAVRRAALAGAWPIATIFVAILGGIYGGLFSPTEGAAVGMLLTFVAGVLRRQLPPRTIARAFVDAAETTAMVFMIFLGADLLNSALALTQLPATLAAWVTGLPVPPLVIVAATLALLIALSCVMDELSLLILALPVLYPAIQRLDLFGLAADDKAVWFGILVLTTTGIGLIAPPVGLNVYVVNGLARDVPMQDTYRGIAPFVASDALRLLLLLAFPALALTLVRALGT